MKYFSNISTPEEQKKQFRAYCVTMHPDKGGDPEEFKNMLNEYEQAAKSCGAWTKETREEVQGVRRGLRVVYFGVGMMETHYIITSVNGNNFELVRIFSHDFRSREDVNEYLGGEWSDEESRREIHKHDDFFRPLSKAFGIGYYWDDVDNKTYTEQEISEAERIADNFDRWAANWKANKEEEERRAQEEADREENAIISEWSAILETLPEEHKRSDGLSYFDMTNEQREAEKVAIKKINAARMATFKRNLKAVFNHFWPGVKCSFKISRSIYGRATVTWTDGPTVAEVEACEVLDYFRAYCYKSDPYADYGDVESREYLKKFRQMFGSFDCDNIDYTRNLSEKTARKAKAEPKATDNTANDDAPAEGLELVEIPGGVAVVGGYYDTLRNRKQIKAHGARWNKEAKQWQATAPEAVARLREWFGMAEPEAEEPKAEEQAAQGEHTHTTASEHPEPKEQPEQPTAEEVERVTRFAALLADVVTMFGQIATAAQKEAQRAKETATKQAEAEQLRADIAKMSAQVAAMSEQLRTMSERLATIEAEANADSHPDDTTGGTADNEPQPEEQAQERPERGEGKPDALDMLRAAAEDVARLTAANDHTAALLARLYVLAAVGLRVRSLIKRAKAIEAAQERGHLTPEEESDRQRISQDTERRAALFLTPEEFRALYGHDPNNESKAA